MAVKTKILKDLKLSLIDKFGNNINDVILFGSQINDSAAKCSDYDILIILKDKPDWQYE